MRQPSPRAVGKKILRESYDSLKVGLPVTLKKANGAIRRDRGHWLFSERRSN